MDDAVSMLGQVLNIAAQGLFNKEIGKRLYISENTVKTQLKSVFAKLGVNSSRLLSQEFDGESSIEIFNPRQIHPFISPDGRYKQA